ncbi:MAG: hypothetical protein JO247_00175 [Chloroflexi bacterium]|nr:hypothetical protein [Chloroflexota bacterium]
MAEPDDSATQATPLQDVDLQALLKRAIGPKTPWWQQWAKAFGAAVLGLAIVSIGSQFVLVWLARVLSWTFRHQQVQQAVTAGGGDQVYSGLILGMLSGASPRGVAARLPLTDWLAHPLRLFFAHSSALAPENAWAVVFGAGSSEVGVQIFQTLTNMLFMVLGAGLLLASTGRARRPWRVLRVSAATIRVAGALCLAWGAVMQFQLPWGIGSGGEMAISMVATKIMGLDSSTYGTVIRHGTSLSFGINLALFLVSVLVGAGLALIAAAAPRPRSLAGAVRWPGVLERQGRWIALPMLLAVLFGISPAQPGIAFLRPADASAVFDPASGAPSLTIDQAEAPGAEVPQAIPTPSPLVPDTTSDQQVRDAASRMPSEVFVVPTGNSFQLWVNGRQQGVRGMGYNPITKGLTNDQRSARYAQDFAAMRAASINTVTGWDENEFDQVLMSRATDAGLGVILPFDLKVNVAYEDPNVQKQLMAAIAMRVDLYRDSPALRMWGLGNEVLHGLGDVRSKRSVAFGQFLIKAADMIHSMDPNHPVVYRDAEDVYLTPVANALRADGVARPWFVYAMNFFTLRMEDALTKGPTKALNVPLMISEFAPVGLRPADRGNGYARLWSIIQAHHDTVLGGVAYVWSTDGPEPLDRTFGLTSAGDAPTDNGLPTLAQLYRNGDASDSAANQASH